jgi:hypothetical protein
VTKRLFKKKKQHTLYACLLVINITGYFCGKRKAQRGFNIKQIINTVNVEIVDAWHGMSCKQWPFAGCRLPPFHGHDRIKI